MAITHFKITRLPSADIIATIGADPLIKDQLYNIELESQCKFERIPSLKEYFVSDSFDYQVYDSGNDRYSLKSKGTIQWKENDLSTPLLSENKTQELILDQQVNLLFLMPINKAVEYVQITSTSGVNNTKHKGVPVIAGDKLTPSELIKATFNVPGGGGYPYFQLKYKLGRGNQLSTEEYTVEINVDTIAIATLESQNSNTYMFQDEQGYSEQYTREDIEIKVSGTPSFAEVEVEISIDFPWVNAAANAQNELSVNGSVQAISASPEIIIVTTTANKDGYFRVKTSTVFQYANGEVYSGSFTVKILTINGAVTDISPEADTIIASITR